MTPSDAPARTMLALSPSSSALSVTASESARAECSSPRSAPRIPTPGASPARARRRYSRCLCCSAQQPALEPVAQLGGAHRQAVALHDLEDLQPDHRRQRVVHMRGVEEEAALVGRLRNLRRWSSRPPAAARRRASSRAPGCPAPPRRARTRTSCRCVPCRSALRRGSAASRARAFLLQGGQISLRQTR